MQSYKPIPFWFFNDNFDKQEIDLQLDIMKNNGVDSFYLHVRDGIVDEGYGTELFFQNVKYIVSKAKEKNIKVWLYDEDSYPSGNLGGRIVIDRPELQTKSLKVEKIELSNDGVARKVLGRVKGLFGYIVEKIDGKEKVKVLDECFGPIRRNWYKAEVDRVYCEDLSDLHYKHLRGETNYTEIVFETKADKNCEVYAAYLEPVFIDQRFSAMADCLNLQTTEFFINNTHEKYRKYVGEFFGDEIPGIFLDEPKVGGIIPYTEELSTCFYNDFGYKVEDNYYKLCAEYQGDKAKFRRDYIKTATKLFNKNFLRPIKEWCNKNGLLMTGHFGGEESLIGQVLCGQNIYRQTRILDIPGFDIIMYNIGSAKRPMLNSGANLVVSAATHQKKDTVLAECFALCPFDLGYKPLKRSADWLFVSGINQLVPHAFHYGYSAFQRADAGKSFFFQDEKFDEYLALADYADRCCNLLHQYKRNNNVLVILPYGALSEEIPLPSGHTGIKKSDRVVDISKRYFDFVGHAISVQFGFDCADVEAVYESDIVLGKVNIGNGEYDTVVVFDVGEEERDLFKYLKSKGVNTVLSEEFKQSLDKSQIFSGNTKDLMAYKKYNEKGQLIFVFNNSEEYCEFSLDVDKYDFVFVYDAEKDKSYRLNAQSGKYSLSLNSYQSFFIILSSEDKLADGEYQKAVKESFNKDDYSNFSLTYSPKNMRFAIDNWKLYTEKDQVKTFEGNIKWARLRDLLGTQDRLYNDRYKIPFFDRAPRLDNIYPQKAVFETKVDFADEKDFILLDKWTFSGDYELFFNGKQVDKSQFIKKRVYDKSNLAFYPKWKKGKNTIQVVFEKGEEFDGINGELYVMKDENS